MMRRFRDDAAARADQVPNGYKQTEVGVIPEDWSVMPLQCLAEKIMVGIASAATHAYRKNGIVMFRNQNIKPGYLDDSDVLFIDPTYEETYRNKRLRAGDLLTARTGYPGTTSIVPPQYEGAQSFTTLITRPRQGAIDSEYLCCFINSEAGQRYFEQNQIGGGQKNVNAGSLKLLQVPLPLQRPSRKPSPGAERCGCLHLIAGAAHSKEAAGQARGHAGIARRPPPPAGIHRGVGGEGIRCFRRNSQSEDAAITGRARHSLRRT